MHARPFQARLDHQFVGAFHHATADRPARRLEGLRDEPMRRYFAATDHTLYGGFRLYWERHGGLAPSTSA